MRAREIARRLQSFIDDPQDTSWGAPLLDLAGRAKRAEAAGDWVAMARRQAEPETAYAPMRELGPVRDLETLDGAPLFASADPQVVREVVQVLVRGIERDDRQPQPPPKLQSVAKPNRPPEKRDAAVSKATDRWGFRFDDPTGEDR